MVRDDAGGAKLEARIDSLSRVANEGIVDGTLPRSQVVLSWSSACESAGMGRRTGSWERSCWKESRVETLAKIVLQTRRMCELRRRERLVGVEEADGFQNDGLAARARWVAGMESKKVTDGSRRGGGRGSLAFVAISSEGPLPRLEGEWSDLGTLMRRHVNRSFSPDVTSKNTWGSCRSSHHDDRPLSEWPVACCMPSPVSSLQQ